MSTTWPGVVVISAFCTSSTLATRLPLTVTNLSPGLMFLSAGLPLTISWATTLIG